MKIAQKPITPYIFKDGYNLQVHLHFNILNCQNHNSKPFIRQKAFKQNIYPTLLLRKPFGKQIIPSVSLQQTVLILARTKRTPGEAPFRVAGNPSRGGATIGDQRWLLHHLCGSSRCYDRELNIRDYHGFPISLCVFPAFREWIHNLVVGIVKLLLTTCDILYFQ